MKKRILSIFLSILTILLVLPSFNLFAEAATDYSAELRKKGFPESYISSLNKLKQAHPNWEFEVLKVGENFADSVAKERPSHSQQLIQNYSGNNGKGYYCTCSKCANNGTPKVMEAPNWVSASQKAVEYYLDPRNFLDEQHVFQFEQIFGNSGNTQEGVESILKGTWMYNANIVYKDTKGNTITYKQNNQTVKYSKAIMDAAKYSGLSAYYLAAKIVQEVGGAKATAAGASGTYKGYEGIFNYYNIAAYTGAADGLKWASYSPSGSYVHTSSGTTVNLRSQPSTSSSLVASIPSGTTITNYEYTDKQADGYKWVHIKSVTVGGKTHSGYVRSDLFVEKAENDTYYRPWTNPYRSIYNGAKWIANNFGSQYNGYLQKFNVNPASKYMHSHEYMANIQAASTEAVKTYTAYKNIGALNSAIKFSIPVFNNMPGEVLPTPTMNTAKVNSNGSFTLSWNAVSGANQYDIYYKSGNGSFTFLKSTTATSYTTVVAGYGKQYSYKVRAVDSTRNLYSSYSNTITAVNNKKLSTPTMNAAKVNDNGSFTLSWSSVVGADQYQIYYKSGDSSSYSFLKTLTATSYTTVIASYEKQYSYEVRAVDSKKKVYSEFSNTVSAVNNKKPSPPKMNTATVNANGSFTLSWNAVAGADKYELYYKSGNGNFTFLKTTTDTSYTTVVAGYGKQYSYKVRAYNNDKKVYSEYSNTITAVNDKKMTVPTMNTAKVNANGSFTLSWSTVTGADQYEIYYKNDSGNFVHLKTTTAASYTTVVAKYEKQYNYKVRAVDSKKKLYSEFSNTVSAINNSKLATPNMNTAKVNNTGSFTLSWNSVAGADKYEIYYKSGNGNFSRLTTTNATSYTTVVANYGTQYAYKVRAIDSSKNLYSEFSNAVSAVNNKKLRTPTMNAAKVNNTGSFTLSWGAVSGADKYEIYYKSGDGAFNFLKTVTATSYTTVSATYGKQYSYKVKALKNNKTISSEFSNIISAVNDKKMSTPTMKAAKVNNAGSFTLSWSAVAGADQYEIYYKSGNGKFSRLTTTTNPSYTTIVASYGVQYTYEVRALDSKKKVYSAFSNAVSAVNNKTLRTPTLNAAKVNDNGSFTLSWNSVVGADKYEVYYQTDNGAYKLMKTTTATSYTTVFAQYKKQYNYKVKALKNNNKIYSEFSNIVSAINNKRLAAPTMNEAKVTANGNFTLSWNAVSGADKYEIYVYNSKTKEYQLNGTVSNKTNATTAYAPYGVNYSYKVRALDSNNNVYSDFSNVISAVNKVMLLTPTLNPVTINENGSFTLSWNSVTGANQYEIHLRNADGTYSLMKTTSATSYTTVVASYGKQYTYRVRAFDSKNKIYSEFTDAVSAVNDKKVAAPKMNAATVNANGSFTLSWNSVAGANQYKIYYKTADSDTYSLLKTTTATTYTTIAAAYAKQYSYKVQAIDSETNGESDFSNIISAVNDKIIPAPTEFKAVANENGRFTLSWNTVYGADNYEIYMKNADDTYSLMKTTTETSYTTVVAGYGKQYTYKVRALDSKKKLYSAFSNTASAVNNTVMEAPKMNAITVNTNGSFTLSWNTVAGADKYEIYIYNGKTFQYNGAVAKTSATTAYAPYGVEYSYKVRALDSKNAVYSEFSNTVKAVNNKRLATPTNVLLEVNTETPSFTISWNLVSGADRYEVYLQNADGTFRHLKTVDDTTTTLNNPQKDKKYTYKIRAVDSKTNAVSDYSNTVEGVY